MSEERQPQAGPAGSPAGEVTLLLAAARGGDRDAFDRVYALVYGELRRIAHGQLRHGLRDPTLSTTALVHEAYLKLVPHADAPLADRQHFFALAARAMRQILVDAARRRQADKRGGEAARVELDELEVAAATRAAEFVALDEALARLESVDERLTRLVELRFFAGLSMAELAELLEVSERTLGRDWRRARAFLQLEMERAGVSS
jgi:RNA polymerase sigma factor (TIGR02999 family)